MYGPGPVGRAQDGNFAPSLTNSARPATLRTSSKSRWLSSRVLGSREKTKTKVSGLEHLKRSMAKCRTAHAFRVKMIRLFNDQSTGPNRGVRRPSAHEE